MSDSAKAQNKQPLYDIELPVSVVVGRMKMSLKELSEWAPDTVVPLLSRADEPVELVVDGQVIATGELCEGDTGPESLALRILDLKEENAE
ncbi:hypothetical protein PB2503_07859 [Parvularcula bermudensis HTCC2503]|uniref:Flagellar motor switch protein FliN-like C-terminal domain-containing protein n=1 Tax=Parvularcula bermudensis (strain ATCC BAA-594 / HTCC2503 / KCTC 12087) TaxID=314260 RepID=E0TH43_PARBH|nr:FliM/FliN family flagellar motor switch protein [Parvularcula bermudensis]ADM09627.1 hypothetical protein PB2503_07859 [Parvularcula bermudensis HTCC2503]